MRDYLYIWHDPSEHLLFASGIEFKDISPTLSCSGGIVLLKHECDDPEFDPNSGFDYLSGEKLSALPEEDLYSWGDFRFIDFKQDHFPAITKQEVSELLYFEHTSTPFGAPILPSLENRFMVSIHDDGWLFKAYYSDWQNAFDLLSALPLLKARPEVIECLHRGSDAFWVTELVAETEDRTYDIDQMLNRRLP